jgi:hypothetical protein
MTGAAAGVNWKSSKIVTVRHRAGFPAWLKANTKQDQAKWKKQAVGRAKKQGDAAAKKQAAAPVKKQAAELVKK